MELTLDSGKVVRDPSESDIVTLIAAEEFAILATDTDTYVQCARKTDSPQEYVLEYQDGSLEQHYEAVGDTINFDQVISTFIKYLRGDLSWRTDLRWQLLEL